MWKSPLATSFQDDLLNCLSYSMSGPLSGIKLNLFLQQVQCRLNLQITIWNVYFTWSIEAVQCDELHWVRSIAQLLLEKIDHTHFCMVGALVKSTTISDELRCRHATGWICISCMHMTPRTRAELCSATPLPSICKNELETGLILLTSTLISEEIVCSITSCILKINFPGSCSYTVVMQVPIDTEVNSIHCQLIYITT